jgi:hypothetical protein
LEIRWIRPGELDPRIVERLDQFPAIVESRADDYLISPDLEGLSVKIRGGSALEVKVYGGSLGVRDVPGGGARGVMDFWQKWSFPLGTPIPGSDSGSGAAWRSVHKVRRMSFFSLVNDQLSARVPGTQQGSGCTVELTEVTMHGQRWWTLGFEATGPVVGLQSLIEETAALVFDHAVADGLALSEEDSGSYAKWLRDRVRSDTG